MAARRRPPTARLPGLGAGHGPRRGPGPGHWRLARGGSRGPGHVPVRPGRPASPADEPLLEAALDDRAEDVRRWAAYLLARLPGSALGQRMAERALRYVRIEYGDRGPRLAVTPPAECDAAMRHDGITPGPAPGRPQPPRPDPAPARDRGADPAARLDGGFGLTAAQVVSVPSGDWAPALFAGWSQAAIAQGDRYWMAALLRRAITGPRPGTPAELEALRQLARRADPALGAPGALPRPELRRAARRCGRDPGASLPLRRC